MKRIISIICVCLLALPITAQVKYSVKVGVGVSQYRGSDDAGNHFSGKIGVGMTIPLKKRWSIEPSLYYEGKGTQFNGLLMPVDDVGDYKLLIARFRNSLHYLTVPVHVAYTIPAGDNTRFQIKAGPYIAVGLKGTANVKTPMYNDYDSDFKEDLFSDGCTYGGSSFLDLKRTDQIYTEPFSRIDFGTSLGVDFIYKHFIIGFNSEIGLIKMSNDFLGGKPHTMAHYLVAGYLF